ncbi:TonB family protein [Niveibacterium sp. SC-1]|uniref:energy transducer TonB family protein n=1 Tax=Niveibacterium sp. SC-1 TaxID=3135646 RepID=UPI00311F4445
MKPVAPKPAAAKPPAPKPAEATPGKKRRLRLPPPGRRIGSENVLWTAVAVSILAHAVALALHFVLPGNNGKRQNDKGLEVVLVNSKHAHAPRDAQVLAQANLDAGGNTVEKLKASTPLPPQDVEREGDALVQQQKRVQELEARQRELLTQSKKPRPANTAPTQKEATEEQAEVQGTDLVENARAIARQEAIIDKQLREYNQRPRKSFVGTRAAEYRFARYVEDWRQKIERVGTLNFPRSSRGKVYGSLLLTVEIRADGSVETVDVKRSSGHRELDEAAIRIVRLAEPYAAFPPDIRKDTDILSITRTWTFTGAETLEAK